jgi:transposase-like protein
MENVKTFRTKPKPSNMVKSWKEKEEALKMLIDNRYNYKLTSEQTGIPAATLRTWKNRYINGVLEAVKQEVDKFQEEVMVATKTIEMMTGQFVEDVNLAKTLTLKQLVKLIPKEKNLSRVTEALKLLHEISSGVDPLSNEGKVVNNYISIIKEMYKIKD